MKNKTNFILVLVTVLSLLLMGCVATQERAKSGQAEVQTPQEPADKPATPNKIVSNNPGKTKDKKGFQIRPLEMDIEAGRPYLPVGAELISKEGKVLMTRVIKRLADLKDFTVSWANDVNLRQMVDVHITPGDNFWEALDNILRQLDYFYEVEGNTIVVKYKETKRYNLVMPTLKENFETSVGGSLIGGGAVEGRITGKTAVEANLRAPFDFWQVVEDNLDTIINQAMVGRQATGQQGATTTSGDKGYFILDQHVGLITVTAPRKTHKDIEEYLGRLKKRIYRQVSIEAKIVEVILNDSSQSGIDWSSVLSIQFPFAIGKDNDGIIYPNQSFSDEGGQFIRHGTKLVSAIGMYPAPTDVAFFAAILDVLKQYGETNILSNPKITIMNGHGASITVGEDITYIDKVSSTSDDIGTITYTVTTGSVLSGLGLAVMANIIDDDEVILYIVPVTSELQPASSAQDIEYRTFGTAQVGLPRVRLRELATMAKMKNGETLIIGGHIDKNRSKVTKKVPLLGDIPGLGWLFKHESETTTSTELVIFLKTEIINPLE